MAWWDKAGAGRLVTRAEIALTITAGVAIFSVAGGRVLLTSIVGLITTQTGNANISLRFVPTAGTAATNTLCALVNVNTFNIGNILTITGVPTDAMIPIAAASVLPNMTMPVILTEGDLEYVCSAAVAGGITWTVWYKPLDDAGAVVAA